MIDRFAKIALVLGAGLLTGRARIEIFGNKNMHDCSDDVLAYHDDEVTLPQKERDEMRDRRNANRDRLKNGLKKAGKPAPPEFKRSEEHTSELPVTNAQLLSRLMLEKNKDANRTDDKYTPT